MSAEVTSTQRRARLEGEQLGTAPAAPLQRAHDGHHRRLFERLVTLLAALGREAEAHPRSVQRHVILPQGGETVALVLVRVVLRADAEQPAVEQPHGCREHAVTPHPVRRQVPPHHPPQLRQRFGELEHLVELLLIAPDAPIGVVEVLLAARRVDPCRLQVAARVHADPYVLPGGRDRQLADAGQRLLVVEPAAVGQQEFEPATAAAALDARLGTIDASQSAHRPLPLSPPETVANARRLEPLVAGYAPGGMLGEEPASRRECRLGAAAVRRLRRPRRRCACSRSWTPRSSSSGPPRQC